MPATVVYRHRECVPQPLPGKGRYPYKLYHQQWGCGKCGGSPSRGEDYNVSGLFLEAGYGRLEVKKKTAIVL
jgi:hypothetical protein